MISRFSFWRAALRMHARYNKCLLYSQVKSYINNVSFKQIVYPCFTANRASYCGLILATRSVSYVFWRKERNNSCIFLRWPVVSEWMVSSVGVSVLVRSGWVSGGGLGGGETEAGRATHCRLLLPPSFYPLPSHARHHLFVYHSSMRH